MKKLILVALALGVSMLVGAQTQTFTRLNQGNNTTDTLNKSANQYSVPVNIAGTKSKSIEITYAVDSISGTPAGSYIIQRSVDGVHWNSLVGDTTSWTGAAGQWNVKKARNAAVSQDTNSFQTFLKTFYPAYGGYLRIHVTTTSATQRSRMWIAIRRQDYIN